MANNTDTTTAPGNRIWKALSPFDDVSANIIFRSYDNVGFRVHTVIMSLASPFFSDMFTLPTTSSTDSTANTQQIYEDGLPIAPFTESSRILRLVLLSCYAINVENPSERDPQGFPATPTLTLNKDAARKHPTVLRVLLLAHFALIDDLSSRPMTFDEYKSLSTALDKYQLFKISDNLLRACITAARADPVLAYAHASRYHFADMKRIACLLTLERPFFPLSTSPDLKVMTAKQYSCLLQYHYDATVTAPKVALEDWTWMTDIPQYDSCNTCNVSVNCPSTSSPSPDAKHEHWGNMFHLNGPKWLFEFVKKTGPLLTITPCSLTVKDQHRLDETFRIALACNNMDCRMRAKEEVRKFSEKFALAVDRAVAKVRGVLKPVYSCP